MNSNGSATYWQMRAFFGEKKTMGTYGNEVTSILIYSSDRSEIYNRQNDGQGINTFMFPAQDAVSGLAVCPASIVVFNFEYHRLATSSLVSSPLHILHEQPVYVPNRFISRYHNRHTVASGGFTNTELTTAHPDQLAEVESLGGEARAVKVVTLNLFVPEFG